MLENAMVYISLEDFKELEYNTKVFTKLRNNISSCYKIQKSEDEKLNMCIDVDALIKATREYSCFGKDNYDCLDYCDHINIIKK